MQRFLYARKATTAPKRAATPPLTWSALAAPVAVAGEEVEAPPPTAPASVDEAPTTDVTVAAEVAVRSVLFPPATGYGALSTGGVYAAGVVATTGVVASTEVAGTGTMTEEDEP